MKKASAPPLTTHVRPHLHIQGWSAGCLRDEKPALRRGPCTSCKLCIVKGRALGVCAKNSQRSAFDYECYSRRALAWADRWVPAMRTASAPPLIMNVMQSVHGQGRSAGCLRDEKPALRPRPCTAGNLCIVKGGALGACAKNSQRSALDYEWYAIRASSRAERRVFAIRTASAPP